MASLNVAPVLSTPDTHIFEDPTPSVDFSRVQRLSDEQLYVTYEVQRTIDEIRARRWKRIALQFPDDMLVDAPRVFEALSRGLRQRRKSQVKGGSGHIKTLGYEGKTEGTANVESASDAVAALDVSEALGEEPELDVEKKLFILADTSYGACCVDEVAAEHVDADIVVHYGRSCLSPVARLPVIYVFTTRPLDLDDVVDVFRRTYPDSEEKIILMADVPYSNHLPSIHRRLKEQGYHNIYATEVVHEPSSALPNRSVPDEVIEEMDTLRQYQLFHVSQPPAALLLTLSSRVGAIHIYETESSSKEAVPASSAVALRRRYALLTRLSTVDIFGILINTLSVKNYLHMVEHVKKQIADAGKKSYTFVVGKVNAAKVANFSEVGGWVVIGCWESSLIESKDFWKPIITPFELGLALKGDSERVWTGEWTSDFQAVLREKEQQSDREAKQDIEGVMEENADVDGGPLDSEEESEPPEFDLRTGRYVSHSRPMRATASRPVQAAASGHASTSLIKRANGDLATIGGELSPAAQFLREKRTWQGLGTDFGDVENVGNENGVAVEQGRSGIARGYTAGEGAVKH